MIDEATDSQLEARLRVAFAEMVPKLIGRTSEPLGSAVPSHELVVSGGTRPPTSRRGLVAAAALVAAAIVGMVVIAQRDRLEVAPSDSSSVLSVAPGSEPAWYPLIRPFIPERFEYVAMTMRYQDEIRFVAIDPTDGKALEIGLARGLPMSNPDSVTTSIDEQGTWVDLDRGWGVQTPSGLNISVTCDLGIGGMNPQTSPFSCEMSTHPFTNAESRSVATAAAATFDISALDADLGQPSDGTFEFEAVKTIIGDALPDQVFLAQTDVGQGDGIVDFGPMVALQEPGRTPDTSVRIIHGLYPSPPSTADPAIGLYEYAAALWVFGTGGVAVRVSTTDGSPASANRWVQLGIDLLASDSLHLTDTNPPPSTTADVPIATTTIPTTSTMPTGLADPRLLPASMPAG